MSYGKYISDTCSSHSNADGKARFQLLKNNSIHIRFKVLKIHFIFFTRTRVSILHCLYCYLRNICWLGQDICFCGKTTNYWSLWHFPPLFAHIMWNIVAIGCHLISNAIYEMKITETLLILLLCAECCLLQVIKDSELYKDITDIMNGL